MKTKMLLLVIAAAAVAPYALSKGQMFLAIEMLVMICIAQSWNFLAGYGGLLSLGHHAFVATGAYVLFLVSRELPISPYWVLPLCGLAAAALALLLTPVLLRLREVYFAIGMWVAAEILKILISRWDFAGGSAGMPLYAARSLNRDWMMPIAYWIALFVAIGICAAIYYFDRSPYGLHLRAMRDNEVAAEAVGVKTTRMKTAVFVASAAGCGVAGAVLFLASLFVTPESAFDINWTVSVIFICIIGGLGTIRGPVIGVVLFFVLRETLAFNSSWYMIALGTLAVVVMLAAPKGLVATPLGSFLQNVGGWRKVVQ